VFPEKLLAVFVDGCFWHGCSTCYRRPHSNQSYWDAKVTSNMARDKKRRADLKMRGWRILALWEHDLQKGALHAVAKIKNRIC
jgi:DNA mismatch endonuclease (patch repair protein)